MMFLHFWTNEYMNHMCEISPLGLKEGKLGVIFTLANIPIAPCQGAGLRFAVTEFTGVTTPTPTPLPTTCHKTTAYRDHN